MALVNSSFGTNHSMIIGAGVDCAGECSYILPNYDFNYPCETRADCGVHASCVTSSYNESLRFCVCANHYTNYPDGSMATRQEENCGYLMKSHTTAVLLAVFLGWTGANWFYLARGNAVYYATGGVKLALALFNFIMMCCACSIANDFRADQPAWKSKVKYVVYVSLLTGIAWWFADLIRVATYAMRDGNGWKMGDF